jgi:hypothetical protein
MGDAGAGKDTVAEVLIESYGYARVAFADPVRQALLALDPYMRLSAVPETWLRLSVVVTAVGWEAAKRDYPEVRRLLQRFGTDSIRALDQNFWTRIGVRAGDLAEACWTPPVFTDTRFPNEVKAVRQNGGVVILVNRPGHTNPASGHVSEEAWRTVRPDYTINNNATLNDLKSKVRFLMDMSVLEDANA